jgi:hypothetical protein
VRGVPWGRRAASEGEGGPDAEDGSVRAHATLRSGVELFQCALFESEKLQKFE